MDHSQVYYFDSVSFGEAEELSAVRQIIEHRA